LDELPPNGFFQIGGYWDQPEVYTFQVEINECQNSSDSEIVCQPQEIIDAFISDDKYVSYYLMNSNLNLNNQ